MEQTVNSKVCTKCNVEKSFDEFNKDKYKKDGLRSECKECEKQHRQANKEKISERAKQYNQANKEKISEQKKQYRQANKEKISERMKQYNQKLEVKTRRKERNNERYKTDPKFHLNNTMSCGIRHSLKKRNSSKCGSNWSNYVDYTLEQLAEHLENQFDDKMTWENQGSYWHIDHIIPVSRFNFTSPYDEEFKKCWALSNLQPLEAIENIRKHDKTMEEWLEYKHKSSHLTPAII